MQYSAYSLAFILYITYIYTIICTILHYEYWRKDKRETYSS